MASRGEDEALRELRCSPDFVLVRRRRRRGRGTVLREKKGSPGALWSERGSPVAERATAKGKRSWKKTTARQEDTEPPVIACPAKPQGQSPIQHPAARRGFLSTLFSSSSVPSGLSSGSSARSAVDVSERRTYCQTTNKHAVNDSWEDHGCERSGQFTLDQNIPVAEYFSGQCENTDEGSTWRVTRETSQQPSALRLCTCQHCGGNTQVIGREASSTCQFQNEAPPTRRCPHFRSCVDPEVDNSANRKSPWLEGSRRENQRPQSSVVRLCSCADCVGAERASDYCDNNVCECSGHAGTDPVQWERTSGIPKPESHSGLNREADHEGCDCVDSQNTGTRGEPCSHTRFVSSCLRCQQQRLLPVPLSRSRDSTFQQRQFHSKHCTCPCLNANHNGPSLSCPSVPSEARVCRESSVGSCSKRWRDWSRMLRMRCVGRCLLLLLLTGLGGLFAHVTFTDYNIDSQHGGGDVTGLFGGGLGVGYGGSHPVNILMKMHMRPVPRMEFHARLRTIRNKFDLLRIFLADKDVSDDSLKQLFASTSRTSSDLFVDSDVTVRSSVDSDAQFTTIHDPGVHIDIEHSEHTTISDADSTQLKQSSPQTDVTESEMMSEGTDVLPTFVEPFHTSDDKSREQPSKTSSRSSKVRHSHLQSDVMKVKGLSENDVMKVKGVSENDADPPGVEKRTAADKVRYTNVKKRDEASLYDDYSDDDVDVEDYLDGEVEYYNDETHADALLEELEEAAYHIASMESNSQAVCKDPQPQVVYIEDPKKQNRQFYPECTVIHRCRNDSGCCGRNHVCGPKKERVVIQTFLAVNVDTTSDTVLLDSQMVERIALVNHTECECREKPRLPDCTQDCPGVFQMYRYGWQCVCDCVSSPNERFPQCDDVKDGLQPLSQDDLVCMKSGKCGTPKCSIGEFDVSSGYCPVKDALAIPSGHLRARLRHQHKLRHARRKSVSEGSGDF
ncbi:uncharacterized protein [Littorina saxatilis]|uniref:uncharacterized protein n=1 Tax=Littorina saxatilis TaxID=31220 RepID=UPI0038B5E4FE